MAGSGIILEPEFRLPRSPCGIVKKYSENALFRWRKSWGIFAMTCSTSSTSSSSPRRAMPNPRCFTWRWRVTTTATLPRWPLVSCWSDVKAFYSLCSFSGDAKAAVVDDSQKAYQVWYQGSHLRIICHYYSPTGRLWYLKISHAAHPSNQVRGIIVGTLSDFDSIKYIHLAMGT